MRSIWALNVHFAIERKTSVRKCVLNGRFMSVLQLKRNERLEMRFIWTFYVRFAIEEKRTFRNAFYMDVLCPFCN